MRPAFYFHEDVNTRLVTATLTFPNCIDPAVRRASSKQQWRTEKMARKDAAFQAYVALYGKGLVNDNLLPLLGYDEERPADVETRQALCEASQTYDPWMVISREWMKLDILYRNVISIERPGQSALSIDMFLPRKFHSFGPFTLYWDKKTTYTASIHDPASSVVVSAASLSTIRLVTSTILKSVHSSRMASDANDFLVLFAPCIDEAELGTWLVANAGEFPASDLRNTLLEHRCGLIRHPSLYGALHILQDFGVDDTIRALPLPKRRDFLHYGYPDRQEADESEAGFKKRQTQILPLQSSTIDKLSLDFVECSLLIPSILHQLWRRLLALDLRNSLLKSVDFFNVEYIITATNAPSSNEPTNYQQLEFFGDSVLKFLVSIHIYHAHRSWPEGYLSRAKDQIVANSRLARAGVEAKLDRYIVSEPFTAKKWAPEFISDYSQPVVTEKRMLSTKVLADVVEALIGGAFLAGGLENAAACTSQLLPEIPATILDIDSLTSSDSAQSPQLPDDYFSGLESFLGHKFRDSRLLKEALTHPSCHNDASTLSYQRLEFVGDTALDMFIISYLTEHAPRLPPGRLHLIKAAMVNAGFLAYLCLKSVVQQDVVDVYSNHETVHVDFAFKERRSSRSVNLCRFMQHQHANIEIALENCHTRFEQMQSDITRCLKYGTYYPWVLLTSLAHEKFVSDIVESLFGAILIDTACNIQACQAFAEKLGLLDYLRRIVEKDIDLRHPKNILGEIASGCTVEYDVGIQEGADGYFCTVRISGMEVAKACNGSSPGEVMTRAAYTAIGIVER